MLCDFFEKNWDEDGTSESIARFIKVYPLPCNFLQIEEPAPSDPPAPAQ